MTNPIHRIYQEDKTFIERPFTEDEILQATKDQEEDMQRKAEADAKAAQKAALLDRLGITEDEAKLLLA